MAFSNSSDNSHRRPPSTHSIIGATNSAAYGGLVFALSYPRYFRYKAATKSEQDQTELGNFFAAFYQRSFDPIKRNTFLAAARFRDQHVMEIFPNGAMFAQINLHCKFVATFVRDLPYAFKHSVAPLACGNGNNTRICRVNALRSLMPTRGRAV